MKTGVLRIEREKLRPEDSGVERHPGLYRVLSLLNRKACLQIIEENLNINKKCLMF